MFKSLVRRISNSDSAPWAAFKKKPTPRVIWGLGFMGLSFTVGWPAVGLLGLLAAHTKAPLLFAVGGPVVYGVSHLVFIVGAYLAGAHHAGMFWQWAIRGIRK
jgi:hypothetical protein